MAGGGIVSEPWYTDDVNELADGDLEAARYTTVHLSDPTEYLYKLVETVRQTETLEGPSETIDRGLRVELAYLIDSSEVTFSRVEYNIKYTIPPSGWISEQNYDKRDLVSYGKSGIEWVDRDAKSIGTTTPRVCKDMIDQAIEENAVDSISDLIQRGLERMIGHKETSNNSSNEEYARDSKPKSNEEYPIVTLFKGKAYYGVTDFTIEQADSLPTRWYRMGDLAEKVGCSTTALSDIQDGIIGYGLLERSNSTEDAAMPRYRIPDSLTVQLLKEFHINYTPKKDPYVSDDISDISLTELMGYSGRAQLIAWFLADADEDIAYSKNKITDNSSLGHNTVRGYIEDLVKLGMVDTKKASRGSQTYVVYVVNTESPINIFLSQLNNTAFAHRSVKEFSFKKLGLV